LTRRTGGGRFGSRPVRDRRSHWRIASSPPIDSMIAAGTHMITPPINWPVSTFMVKARPQISKIG
jgi:hypothetical protein